MEKEGKVSIWVGKFNSEEALKEYVQEVFDEEGDSTSSFMNDFNIDYIDPQFQEVDFNDQNNDLFQKINGFSYAESFINQLPILSEGINSVICLYNFQFNNGIRKSEVLKYIGTYDYTIE
ncbi:immunity 22 family protein [Winogradskyella sp. SYSU M77433]|uniref:immunity 22 family protein n=1 Tax=Winogradskyella sp. SYSU M77433 TaxID=3042722 RepID=UPI0024803581|nr:immunity 22 family protein [Winogradskyella sp. SYSU M77433]MDH7913736.1 immunity 22 family protein [Winogradskyella sp. SYSU M77433]